VLGDILPYDEVYRPVMAEGVINAKYSMIDWETNKKNGLETKAVRKDTFWANLDEPEHPEEQEDRIETDAERLERQAWMERRAAAVEDVIRFAQQAQPNVAADAIGNRFTLGNRHNRNPLLEPDWTVGLNPGTAPLTITDDLVDAAVPQQVPQRVPPGRTNPAPRPLRRR
jgi:hypothetical protein